MNQIRATGVAAFFLGVGLAGAPIDLLGVLFAALVVTVLVVALERPGTAIQAFAVGFFGVLLSSILQHAGIVGHGVRPSAVATRLYFGLYPGSVVVALGLGLLSASTQGLRRAPAAIAGIGTLVGVSLYFLL